MKRLPIVRHIRYFHHLRSMKRHYARWAKLGMSPVNIKADYAVLDMIWRGEA